MVMINCSVSCCLQWLKNLIRIVFMCTVRLISLTGGVRSHGGQETVIIGESGTAKKPFESLDTDLPRFMSEFGFQSFPEMKTIAAFAASEDYQIESEVMNAHQKSSIGNVVDPYLYGT